MATTGITGKVYSATSGVKAIESMELGEFRGKAVLDIAFSKVEQKGQSRFAKEMFYYEGSAKLIFEEMEFKAETLNLLWNISANSGGFMSDGITIANIYQITQASYPAELEVLFQMRRTDNKKLMEIEARRAICESLSIPFPKTDFSVFDCVWLLLADNSGGIVRLAVEE